jgi:hypothetical protein
VEKTAANARSTRAPSEPAAQRRRLAKSA